MTSSFLRSHPALLALCALAVAGSSALMAQDADTSPFVSATDAAANPFAEVSEDAEAPPAPDPFATNEQDPFAASETPAPDPFATDDQNPFGPADTAVPSPLEGLGYQTQGEMFPMLPELVEQFEAHGDETEPPPAAPDPFAATPADFQPMVPLRTPLTPERARGEEALATAVRDAEPGAPIAIAGAVTAGGTAVELTYAGSNLPRPPATTTPGRSLATAIITADATNFTASGRRTHAVRLFDPVAPIDTGPPEPVGEITWFDNLEEAVAKARAENKRMVLVLLGENRESVEFEVNLLGDREVIEVIGQAVAVRIIASQEREYLNRYSVRTLPSLLVLNQLGYSRGFVGTGDPQPVFLTNLRQLLN